MRDGKPKASVWLRHDSMGYFHSQMKPKQPGANGVQYSPNRGYLYYTSTAKQLFMRVKVEPETCDPVGEPEVVGGGRMFDDFCIDQDAGFAYLTTHRQNTIDRLSLRKNRLLHPQQTDAKKTKGRPDMSGPSYQIPAPVRRARPSLCGAASRPRKSPSQGSA
jgi:sugar lactone lactonase YvrE